MPEDTRPRPEMLLWLSRHHRRARRSPMLADPDAADFSTEVGRAKFRLLMEQVDRAARLAKQCSEANAEQVEATVKQAQAVLVANMVKEAAKRAGLNESQVAALGIGLRAITAEAAARSTPTALRLAHLADARDVASPPPRSSASPLAARRPNASVCRCRRGVATGRRGRAGARASRPGATPSHAHPVASPGGAPRARGQDELPHRQAGHARPAVEAVLAASLAPTTPPPSRGTQGPGSPGARRAAAWARRRGEGALASGIESEAGAGGDLPRLTCGLPLSGAEVFAEAATVARLRG